MTFRPSLVLATAVLLAACTPPAATVPATTPAPTDPNFIVDTGAPAPVVIIKGAALIGKIKAPQAILDVDGTTILSNNGESLVSQTKLVAQTKLIAQTKLVSQTKLVAQTKLIAQTKLQPGPGVGILSNTSGGIVTGNTSRIVTGDTSRYAVSMGDTSRYALQAGAGPDGVLTSAFLTLTDRDGKHFIDRTTFQPFAVTTGETGDYRFPIADAPGFPVGKDVVVNAVVQGLFRLTGYVVPGKDGSELQVDLASTLTTELLRAAALEKGQGLGIFPRAQVDEATALTRQALESGDIPAVTNLTVAEGEVVPIGLFDLRLDRVAELRNQYVAAMSAVAVDNATVRRLSDLWKGLLGYRPAALTTLLGSGDAPTVTADGVTGDAATAPGSRLPAGYPNGLDVSERGDIFVASYTAAPGSGHIRWIKPDGRVATVWSPDYQLAEPYSVKVEREPTDDPANPGSLLVADAGANRVVRLAIVDVLGVTPAMVDGTGRALPRYRPEVVAGDAERLDPAEGLDPAHPAAVDGDVYAATDGATPATSLWRLADEGDRRYQSNGQPVPAAARFAHLYYPTDVAVDEAGHIYIADRGSHRVRMIPKADGRYFGYRAPVDKDGDGAIDSFGDPVDMLAGRIYTIVGNAKWDPAKTPADGNGRWFGEFADSDGKPAQQAFLDQPNSLAFHGGQLYISDFDNQRIRRVDRATGIIDSIAGAPPSGQRSNAPGDYDFPPGAAGDGGPAKAAQLAFPQGVTVDANGNVYIADDGSGRIRMVDPSGTITTVAGKLHDPDHHGDAGDQKTDGDALRWVDLYSTFGIGVDAQGNVILSDSRHSRVRKVWRQWEAK